MLPKSVTSFKAKAVKLFKAANPDAADASIVWTHAAKVTWADGTVGYSGLATVTAAGYKPSTLIASWLAGHGFTVKV